MIKQILKIKFKMGDFESGFDEIESGFAESDCKITKTTNGLKKECSKTSGNYTVRYTSNVVGENTMSGSDDNIDQYNMNKMDEIFASFILKGPKKYRDGFDSFMTFANELKNKLSQLSLAELNYMKNLVRLEADLREVIATKNDNSFEMTLSTLDTLIDTAIGYKKISK